MRKAGYLVGAGRHPFGWWLPGTLAETLGRLARHAQPLDVALIRSIFIHEIPALRRVWPGRIVVDCHDSDVHLAGELLTTVRGAARLGPWANLLGVRRVVARYLPLADEVWAASAEDAARLGGQARGARLLVVPSGMDERQAATAAEPGIDGTACSWRTSAMVPTRAERTGCSARCGPRYASVWAPPHFDWSVRGCRRRSSGWRPPPPG